jgi:hypothetical protein
MEWEGHPSRSNTVYYAKYNNLRPGAYTYGRVNWQGYRIISSSMEDAEFTVRTSISRDTWILSSEVPYEPDLIKRPLIVINLAKWDLAKNNLVMVLIFSFYIMMSIY